MDAAYEFTMPFGKHKGKPVSEIPESYLNWLIDNVEMRPSLCLAVYGALDQEPVIEKYEAKIRDLKQQVGQLEDEVIDSFRQRQRTPDNSVMFAQVEAVRRQYAKRFHPDLGGDGEIMTIRNCVIDSVKESVERN